MSFRKAWGQIWPQVCRIWGIASVFLMFLAILVAFTRAFTPNSPAMEPLDYILLVMMILNGIVWWKDAFR